MSWVGSTFANKSNNTNIKMLVCPHWREPLLYLAPQRTLTLFNHASVKPLDAQCFRPKPIALDPHFMDTTTEIHSLVAKCIWLFPTKNKKTQIKIAQKVINSSWTPYYVSLVWEWDNGNNNNNVYAPTIDMTPFLAHMLAPLGFWVPSEHNA